MNTAVTYDEILNYAGGNSCANEGQFILKVAELAAAESMGLLTISADAKNKLRQRFTV